MEGLRTSLGLSGSSSSSSSSSGAKAAASLVSTVAGDAFSINNADCEYLCQIALEASGEMGQLEVHNSYKEKAKKQQPRGGNLTSLEFSLSSPSTRQLKNQSIRFGLESSDQQRHFWLFDGSDSSIAGGEGLRNTMASSSQESHGGVVRSNSAPSSSSSLTSSSSSRNSIAALFGTNYGNDDRDYEDVVDPEILLAPITEICVLQRGEVVPPGYYRLSRTPKNKKANLNAGSGGNQIFFCILKQPSGREASTKSSLSTASSPSSTSMPITGLQVIFPDRNEFVPPGFQVVKRDNVPSNLNSGTSAERVFLCYKKEKTSNPIVDLQIILPGKNEEPPKGYSLIDFSPTGRPANLNSGNGGGSIYICYRQRLQRLACLANNSPFRSGSLSAKSSPSPSSSLQALSDRTSLQARMVRSTDSLSSHASGSFSDSASGATYARSESPIFGQSTSASTITGNRIRTETEDSRYDASTTSDPPAITFSNPGSSNSNNSKDLTTLYELKEEDSGGKSERLTMLSLDVDEDMNCDADVGPSVDELMADKDRSSRTVVDYSGQLVPDPTRRLLHALLSATYIRQGKIAETVVRGLTSLLKDTDFFESDLTHTQQPGTLTLLDVTIEAICDRVEICIDEEYATILGFLQVLIKHSRGRLSPISLQRVFRALSFLLNCYSTRNAWIKDGLSMPLENDEGGDTNAYKVLRDLVWSVVAQIETVDVASSLPPEDIPPISKPVPANLDSSSPTYSLAHDFVLGFIEELIDSVEVSRIAESTQLAISKQSSSTSLGSFWQHINVLSRRLFVESPHRSAFVVLCAITKLAWHDVRNISSSPMPRDLGTKVLAFEALLEFCVSAGERMRVSKVMGYMIRRLVVPCLLYNVQFGLKDHRVFSKLMKIITALWKVWRSHVRIEFALLVEQIVIRVMQADMVKIRPVYQMIVIQEVVTWFDQPHLLVEMFVNYDMDSKFVSHWNIFSHLIRAVCSTARKVSLVTGAWDWKPRSESGDESDLNKKNSVSIRSVQMQALEEVGRISKTLMDATGHAYLILQDAKFRNKALGAGTGWEEDIDDVLPPPLQSPSGLRARHASFESTDSVDGNTGEDGVGGHPVRRGSGNSAKITQGVKFRRAVHLEAEELLKEAIKIYEEKSSLLKAVRYLIDRKFMGDTPQEIASFLRVYKNSLDPSAIGDFLGEGGKTPSEGEYWSQIRFRYTRAVSFVEMDVEPALRLYLTGCGFRLPGEAQKVDRFVEVFVKTFWQDNSGTAYCPFSHPDAVHLVTFAIIMLNTDHHRANISKTKKAKRMTKEEFIHNLRGADNNHDIDRDYLCRIYDNVQAEAIEMAVGSSEAPGRTMLPRAPGETSALSSLASLSVLSFRPSVSSADLSFQEEQKFFRDVTRTLRDSEDLLRSLSSFTYGFQLTGVDTNISMDLVSFMYETVWFHFRAITESLLSQKHKNDMYAVFIVLDILCYSLTASIFLGLKVEAMTFAEQLQSFLRTDCEGVVFPETSWFQDISVMVPETAMETIAKVHTLMVHVKDAVQESANREVTRSVAARIEKKANVLENNSFFVREGDLAKRNRNGRFVGYRFFLFSDNLIYAHQGMSGEYKVHGMLHLTQLTVTDFPSDANKCSLYIQHPIKSFVVVADSPGTKQQWLRDLQQTIANCCRRAELQQNNEGRRRKKSLLERIESQQRVMDKEKLINSPVRESSSSSQPGQSGGKPPLPRPITPVTPETMTTFPSFALPSGDSSAGKEDPTGSRFPISPPQPPFLGSDERSPT